MTNPYAPPKASVADADAPSASISVRGLARMFQILVISSAAIGLFLSFWGYLPIPLSADDYALLTQNGASAIAPGLSDVLWRICQPLWILAALGLYAFQSWGRYVLLLAYVLSSATSLMGGVQVRLPWESLLLPAVTLMDGAVFLLAFTPPISSYFARQAPSATR
jgi:hypothetical protein